VLLGRLQETDLKRQQTLIQDIARYCADQAYVVPRPGAVKGLSLNWPVIGNEGLWNTAGVGIPGGFAGSGNPFVETRIHWWYDASQPPAKSG